MYPARQADPPRVGEQSIWFLVDESDLLKASLLSTVLTFGSNLENLLAVYVVGR